jgi:hypothetical protein
MTLAGSALLFILAQAPPPQPADLHSPVQVCKDEMATCKEECTIDFGSSVRSRNHFYKCMQKCDRSNDTCLERYLKAHKAGLNPGALDKDGHDRDDVRKADESPTSKGTKPPAPHEDEEVAPVERSATRGEELGPPVDKNPTRYPGDPLRDSAHEAPPAQTTASKQGKPDAGVQAAAPKPGNADAGAQASAHKPSNVDAGAQASAAKPGNADAGAKAAAAQGKTPEPPKKKDLSEWDPGDIR